MVWVQLPCPQQSTSQSDPIIILKYIYTFLVLVVLFAPLKVNAVEIPRTEKEAISRYIVARAKEANIDPKWFLATAMCESGLKSTALNPTSKTMGIMQIHPIHRTVYRQMGLSLFNYEDNIDFAIYLYSKNGKWPWLASKECAEKKMKELALDDS